MRLPPSVVRSWGVGFLGIAGGEEGSVGTTNGVDEGGTRGLAAVCPQTRGSAVSDTPGDGRRGDTEFDGEEHGGQFTTPFGSLRVADVTLYAARGGSQNTIPVGH